ncbi:MAG: acyl--CoA ligase [Deltaproteobacteria bacterium]|nr:acyl--CoA ligase [Deltaproteobacteria bacterium]
MTNPLELPRDAQAPFCRASYGQIYALAARLRDELGAVGRACVATQDRDVLAACALASLAGGPELVLPYALSGPVLAAARRELGFEVLIVGEREAIQLAGIELVCARAEASADRPPARQRGEAEILLHLFTGGSTGGPRAWPKTAANLMGEAAFQTARFSFAAGDAVLSSAGPLHIYGLLFSVLVPLLAGARVLARPAFLPAEIESALSSGPRPSVYLGTPAHYRSLRLRCAAETGLRLALSSGGMLDEKDALGFAERYGCPVVEAYGSTETGGIATRCRAEGQASWTALRPVRIGFSGGCLAVDSPFLSPGLERDASGLFATADRAAPAGEGRFDLLGRADRVVKVGGERVDLDAVEAVLRAIDGVEDACVLALDQAGRDKRVVAAAVGSLDEKQLRAALARKLEPAWMPRQLRLLDRIPTTAAGKHDREAVEAMLSGPRDGP